MKKIILSLLSVSVLLLLPGCGKTPEAKALTGVTFERGNGSQWGNQLYISIRENEITTLRYIPEGTGQLETVEHLSITPEEWQTVADGVKQLSLEEEKTGFLEKLLPKKDGGDFRRLTLQWEAETLTCKWPATEEAAAFEKMLEALALSAAERNP